MASRVHPHSPLPAPALHASVVSNQSKSHVLAGVQDAYWSDDEAEDAECPLCLEEMDISDLNFKPCPCGYQICRFCWHHIKENLNGRCPACRREYTDETVQFKPINKDDHKRLTQQKKQRERERKELEALNRRHLANVRVVQRNVVYVLGMGQRFAKEELIPTLRSNEYFGQYGKISKIVIVKRTSTGARAPVVGLYITYHRREDAARCISAIDGAPSPGGGGEIMRASYGTTKYCMAFLRGVSCTDHSCMSLHEWGDENDCFTKEDLTTLKHTMKDTETRTRITTVRKGDESEGLPRAASWANRPRDTLASTALHNTTGLPPAVRQQTRRAVVGATRPARPGSSTTVEARAATAVRRTGKEASGAAKTPSVTSSRPATPVTGRPTTPATAKQTKVKEALTPLSVPQSPALSVAVQSDVGSGVQEASPAPSPPQPVQEVAPTTTPAIPPGIPAAPPGLAHPPGLPASPALPPPSLTSPPGLPLPSQGPYQISAQAQQLLEDVRARRESAFQSTNAQSPFPDFDRMIQNLTEDDTGFSFKLDPKLAGESADAELTLPDLEADANTAFAGSFMDAFPGLRQTGQVGQFAQSPSLPQMPPGLGYVTSRSAYGSPAPERQSSGSSYTGSFNPFAESTDEPPARRFSPFDEERKVSRFGFARGRQGSTSSPLAAASPIGHADNVSQNPFYNAATDLSPSVSQAGGTPWAFSNRYDYIHSNTPSATNSPLVQQAQAQPQAGSLYNQQAPQQSRFQPFETSVSEAQLRDFISQSRNRTQPGPSEVQTFKYTSSQPFNDPAIMSARVASPLMPQAQTHDGGFVNSPSIDQLAYGPPPGLAFPQAVMGASAMQGQAGGRNYDVSQASGSAHVSTSTSVIPSPALSSSDFPALREAVSTPSANVEKQSNESPATSAADSTTTATPPVDSKAQAKAELQAAKRAERAERAAARQLIAQEKAAARAAEKERIAQEKAVEKERLAKEKAEKEKEKEKAEKEKAERERVAKEKAAREKEARERAEAEKERLEKEKAENAKKEQEEQTRVGAKASKQTASTPPAPSGSANKGRKKEKATAAPPPPPEPEVQAPILAKLPKKNRPITKPIRIPKEESSGDHSALASAATSETPQLPETGSVETRSHSNDSRAQSVDVQAQNEPLGLDDLFADIDMQVPWMNIPCHAIFDSSKINPAPKMPLEYGPLVHALSALSVGGGSFANNMPSGSIDNAVSSFQQLLETLTQTISDLLRLLPRATWDDSSSFDGVLRDMLKGDDFLDEGGDEHNQQGREDEVAALTMALERRARWMEVQLSKLEELHRDINTAAVRAVLSFNDNGWDRRGSAYKQGNSLARFDQLGTIEENGRFRAMKADELEKKLIVAKEAAAFAEAELKEAMGRVQDAQPLAEDEW